MDNVKRYYDVKNKINVLGELITELEHQKEFLWRTMRQNEINEVYKREGVEV